MKVLGWLVLVVALAAGGLLAFLALKKPAMRPPSTEKIEATPARLARGRYLVENVSDCLGCHSDFHKDRFAIPTKRGTEGQGGFPFDKSLGVPGLVQAQNISSDPEYGLGNWTDGEILRAFREGIKRDGTALFPMMPYQKLRVMSDEDARSVVVYLRTLKPIRHAVAARRLDFPVNFLVKFEPKPLDGPVPDPDPKDMVAYGRYLATIGGCVECHTPMDSKGRRDRRSGIFRRMASPGTMGPRGLGQPDARSGQLHGQGFARGIHRPVQVPRGPRRRERSARDARKEHGHAVAAARRDDARGPRGDLRLPEDAASRSRRRSSPSPTRLPRPHREGDPRPRARRRRGPPLRGGPRPGGFRGPGPRARRGRPASTSSTSTTGPASTRRRCR